MALWSCPSAQVAKAEVAEKLVLLRSGHSCEQSVKLGAFAGLARSVWKLTGVPG